ncbi:hypothetical protein [Ammoniphilus sp. CFH 90114]|uniref:hypothetical protein n=1 Tax=Ammoniphilus sp. CFH 90114 TaxID=2493665 RepID=UPI00100DE794|nr:hypothetical protein [Ammoniphilus sp. CFH 90114]RXT05807.1 hypothetical protein EIZ39_17030 [Ammoniphilus sp. CFH 90114]
MRRGWIKWGVVLLFAISIILLPYFSWVYKESQALDVVILDNTVPNSSYREHKGLIWLLNHFKYVRSQTQSTYSLKDHYFGFVPSTDHKYEIKELEITPNESDLIYIADTYGVYEEDYYGHTANSHGVRSDKIYGGLRSDDLEKIKAEIYRGKTLIAEFNTFGSPTEESVRQSLYKILGLEWSGWIGRSFADLTRGKEVPAWAVSNYEKKYGTPWNYKGYGLVFVNEQDDIIVLEGGKEAGKGGSRYSLTEEGKAFFGPLSDTRYNYWFDIVEATQPKSVLAEYHLDVTEEGKKLLDQHGIPAVFPAVVKNATGVYTSYYFAGDYADSNELPSLFQFAGFDRLISWLSWDSKESLEPFFWRIYLPMMENILADTLKEKENRPPPNMPDMLTEDGTQLVARTHDSDLQIYQNGNWETFFAKGVNMGMALPGKWFTEFPKDEADYLRWLTMIGEMNSNTVRVYTLMEPAFYRALAAYNKVHPDEPLWLMQEIWPEEHPEHHDFLGEKYNRAFHEEIEYVIDAIHGKAKIPERKGRAYGEYTVDVSAYVVGYLVGRELEPEEVLETDKRHPDFQFEGDYLSAKGGSPTENWLAWSCDYVLAYEEKTYGWQHPVAIVSWPTLDALKHDAEWNAEGDPSKLYNDKATVDIRNLSFGPKMKAGLFGAYHIYPNYPDFMNNEQSYDDYQDEEGRLRYGGYLQQFMKIHQGFPAVVAEYGLATGMGNAHHSPDGYHHGGMSEEQQGLGVVRMTKAIHREGYAGALIFEWMDEWAKKTWITEPFMIPYERHVMWHNAIDPEQNYGLLAMEPKKPSVSDYSLEGEGLIRKLKMSADEAFLHIDLTLSRPVDWSKDELLIGLDTFDKTKGEFRYRSGHPLTSPTGLEFLIELKSEQDAKLLVIPSYNIAEGRFSSGRSQEGRFEEMRRLINKGGVRKDGTTYGAHFADGSSLKYGTFVGNYNHWNSTEDRIHLRLPWGRINVTDPTSLQVLNDSRNLEELEGVLERDELRTEKTEGIRVSAVWLDKNQEVVDLFPGGSKLEESPPYQWKEWNKPVYKERLKESYPYIQEYFKSIP